MKDKRKAGSFTIEAALLMPFLLGVFLFILYMGFYLYNRAVCTQICYVCSRDVGYGQADGAAGDLQAQKNQLQKQLIGAGSVELYEEEEKDKITVTAKAKMKLPLIGAELSIQETQWCYRLDQRAFILRISGLLRRLVGDDLK